jgi:hypothetical protein
MFGTAQRIGLVDSPLTEDLYSSIETEELEQLFNAGINNGRGKEDKAVKGNDHDAFWQFNIVRTRCGRFV